ncbi:hypothetical protein FNF29_00542 [Cafeteria roenbergensis]|uniref:Vacuolar membrane-associated protein Iml1 N-terminal domain-containing protein n=1 Tax=Cafeteria roenbergensis TaxID=33653 RepID=A0A5A8CYB7_CAFRO|nr:hypothetical protein FNF29_00542 [Cafeteria roenbergensis]|eukprot:KAA0157190.1 hypothetical protein FNF29_00542 [Cafeteria roenbergensis]
MMRKMMRITKAGGKKSQAAASAAADSASAAVGEVRSLEPVVIEVATHGAEAHAVETVVDPAKLASVRVGDLLCGCDPALAPVAGQQGRSGHAHADAFAEQAAQSLEALRRRSRVVLKVGRLATLRGRAALSIATRSADLLHISARQRLAIWAVSEQSASLGLVEASCKGTHMPNGEVWRLTRAMAGMCLHEGEMVTVGGTRLTIKALHSAEGSRVRSGLVGSATRVALRSRSAHVVVMFQASSDAWDVGADGRVRVEAMVSFVQSLLRRWSRLNCDHRLTLCIFSRSHLDVDPAVVEAVAELRELASERLRSAWRGLDGTSVWLADPDLLARGAVAALETAASAAGKGVSEVGALLEAINCGLDLFAGAHRARDMARHGQHLVVVSAGQGIFHVDAPLTRLTKQRMREAERVVVFGFDQYRMPHWLHASFYRPDDDDDAAYSAVGSDPRKCPPGPLVLQADVALEHAWAGWWRQGGRQSAAAALMAALQAAPALRAMAGLGDVRAISDAERPADQQKQSPMAAAAGGAASLGSAAGRAGSPASLPHHEWSQSGNASSDSGARSASAHGGRQSRSSHSKRSAPPAWLAATKPVPSLGQWGFDGLTGSQLATRAESAYLLDWRTAGAHQASDDPAGAASQPLHQTLSWIDPPAPSIIFAIAAPRLTTDGHIVPRPLLGRLLGAGLVSPSDGNPSTHSPMEVRPSDLWRAARQQGDRHPVVTEEPPDLWSLAVLEQEMEEQAEQEAAALAQQRLDPAAGVAVSALAPPHAAHARGVWVPWSSTSGRTILIGTSALETGLVGAKHPRPGAACALHRAWGCPARDQPRRGSAALP